MIARRNNVNPELEALRNSGLREAAAARRGEAAAAETLAESLNRIHASFLFTSDHEEILQRLCIHMSSTSAGIHDNSWNALAVGLGFSHLQVECIKHTSKEDFTLLVLKSYATKPNAVLGDIIKVLKKINRLDALGAIRDDLTAIAASREEDLQNEDSGFSSVDGSSESSILIYPQDFNKLRKRLDDQLLFTVKQLKKKAKTDWREDAVKTCDAPRTRHREENRVQGASIIRTPKVKPKYNVFLTYACDGADVARRITRTFRQNVRKRPQIGVLILEEHSEKVMQNPESFIMHYFYKMSYVIPILTEGYMNAIAHTGPIDDSLTTSLDTQYVQYIHNLGNKYYCKNNCFNDKIRCVVPIDRRSILEHTHRKLDPIMSTYVYDVDIEKLAKRITRTIDDDD